VLTRDQILSAKDLKTTVVKVPEWDGEVTVRGMTGEERDAFEAAMYAAGDDDVEAMRNIRARYAATCIVGENGERLFTDADVTALGRKSAAALSRVFEAARRLSGLTAKDQEGLEKN